MRALVTGGGGFLGGAIVRGLLARGDAVRSVSRGDYPALREAGVETRRGDLADLEAAREAVRGVDTVFHCAAKAGVWGRWDDYFRSNVLATAHVIAACRAEGVPRLVFTSSPSVVFAGGDIEGGDESLPYARRFKAPYPATKAEAERLVLAANGPELATVALRPHLVWGPGDNHLVPRIVARGRAGKLRRLGRRPCRVDSVFVDDAAEAHLLAADRLAPGAAPAGKAYFVSQGEPWPLWDLVNGILEAHGVPPARESVPAPLAYAAGTVLEGVYGLLGIEDEPPMTRFLAEQLSTAHWFDLSAARRDLGFAPKRTIRGGLEELRRWVEAGSPAVSVRK